MLKSDTSDHAVELGELAAAGVAASLAKPGPVCGQCELPAASVDGYGFCSNCMPTSVDLMEAGFALASDVRDLRGRASLSDRMPNETRLAVLAVASGLERVVRWLDAVRLSR
jgi:hypothetical protein